MGFKISINFNNIVLILLFVCIIYISITVIKKMYINLLNLNDINNEDFTNSKKNIKKIKNDKKKNDKKEKIILKECLSGCPFDRKSESPCKYKECFDNPEGKECISEIKKFCKNKDISKRNKLGCDIYYAVQNTEPEFMIPEMEPRSLPSRDHKDLAMIIPQFVEIDILHRIQVMKKMKEQIIKREMEEGPDIRNADKPGTEKKKSNKEGPDETFADKPGTEKKNKIKKKKKKEKKLKL